MGNRIASQPESQSRRRRQHHVTDGSLPPRYSVRPINKYLQPPSDTINEYKQSYSQQYQTTQTDCDFPLEPLSYQEAYEHLRELAEKRIGKGYSKRDSHEDTTCDTAKFTTNKHHCKEMHSTLDSRQKKRTMSVGGEPSRATDSCLMITSGLGDYTCRRSGEICVSDSDDATIQVEMNITAAKPPTGNRVTSSFDFIPQTGDAHSISVTSTTSGEYCYMSGTGTRKRLSAPKTDDNLRRCATITRNLRTVGSPLSRRIQTDKASVTERELTNTSSGIKSDDPSRVRRSLSVCPSPSSTKFSNITPRLGFQTEADGTVTYTAFLTAGPCGVPTDGWLNDIRRRACRHLIGLRRQYRCQVHFDPTVLPYRGLYVHTLVISGQTQSDLIRCRNALPRCIEKHLITPYAQHGMMLKRAR